MPLLLQLRRFYNFKSLTGASCAKARATRKPFPGHASLLLIFSALITSDQILHSLTLDSIDYCRFILCVRYDNACVQTSSPCDSPDKQERWACIRPRLDLTRGKRQVRGDIWVTPHNTCKAQTRTGHILSLWKTLWSQLNCKSHKSSRLDWIGPNVPAAFKSIWLVEANKPVTFT